MGINNIVMSIIIAKSRESENILPFEVKNSWLSNNEYSSFPISSHWENIAPMGTNIESWSNWARLLILPPRTETTHAQIKVMNSRLLLMFVNESGQLRLAIETQAKAVIVPIPWEIIKAGGMMIDKGLNPGSNIFFIIWTTNSSEIINKICLELMFGFSFLETSIKNPHVNKTSAKFKPQEKTSETPNVGAIRIL